MTTSDDLAQAQRVRGRPRKAATLSQAERSQRYRQRHSADLERRKPGWQRRVTVSFLWRATERSALGESARNQGEALGAAGLAYDLGWITREEYAEVCDAVTAGQAWHPSHSSGNVAA